MEVRCELGADVGVGSFEDDIAVEFSICVGGFKDIGDLRMLMSGGNSDICGKGDLGMEVKTRQHKGDFGAQMGFWDGG
jgi:hypothetical protein